MPTCLIYLPSDNALRFHITDEASQDLTVTQVGFIKENNQTLDLVHKNLDVAFTVL